MYLNRGNHETKDMNRTYGFEGEAKAKHGEQSYKVSAGRLFLFSGFLTCCSSCSLMHSLPVRHYHIPEAVADFVLQCHLQLWYLPHNPLNQARARLRSLDLMGRRGSSSYMAVYSVKMASPWMISAKSTVLADSLGRKV